MIAEAVYVLCALTSAACAVLLFRAFARSRLRLLLWSGICFVGIGLSNVLLVIDLIVIRGVDLSTWRVVPAALGFAVFVYGLVWEAE